MEYRKEMIERSGMVRNGLRYTLQERRFAGVTGDDFFYHEAVTLCGIYTLYRFKFSIGKN
jgi:hypothetical protein